MRDGRIRPCQILSPNSPVPRDWRAAAFVSIRELRGLTAAFVSIREIRV